VQPGGGHGRRATAANADAGSADAAGGGAMIEHNTVHNTDLLSLCADIEPASVDMILCDLPYGVTSCNWDSVIPFAPMWAAFKRIVKPRAAIVLTASQPFTSALVMSNPKWFKYSWVWQKSSATGFMNASIRPLVEHEDVLVFANDGPDFYPQPRRREVHSRKHIAKKIEVYSEINRRPTIGIEDDNGYPKTVLQFNVPFHDREAGHHPTQKPTALFLYLIRTYTRPGDLVVDPCVGSGTTALAARAEGRHYIVGDSSAEYVAVTEKRLAIPYTLPMLFADASTEAG
jgi:site-specific DNA-methyltransferase (adenine-specific)